MISEKCNICDELFNKKRTKINCVYCNFEACKLCSKQYILSQTHAKCMNNDCGKEWSRNFMKINFNDKISTNELKKHTEDILYGKEQSLMPATQQFVEDHIFNKETTKKIIKLENLIFKLNYEKNCLLKTLITNEKNNNKENSNYVRKCNFLECRGFLNNDWYCGICKNITCNKCHEIKNPDILIKHECDPDLVKTALMIEKETKPCPKCQAKIFKIDGCDQMWCTQCHTAFNWRTGKIEKTIHNPHYFEWMRNNSTNETIIEDNICRNELTHDTALILKNAIISNNHELYMIPLAKKFKTKEEKISDLILPDTKIKKQTKIVRGLNNITDIHMLIIQNIIHISQTELEKFNQIDDFELNKKLRIQFMSNEIDENKFKKYIQQNDKKNKKNKEILDVLTLAITAVTDIIYRIIDNFENKKPFEDNFIDLSNELQELRNYCNDLFENISFNYNCVQYCFEKNFKFKKYNNPNDITQLIFSEN